MTPIELLPWILFLLTFTALLIVWLLYESVKEDAARSNREFNLLVSKVGGQAREEEFYLIPRREFEPEGR